MITFTYANMSVAREEMAEAYEDVRSDSSPTEWALFTYDESGKNIALLEKGQGYDNFLALLKDDQRAYGFVRVETGDELRYKTPKCTYFSIRTRETCAGSRRRSQSSG